MTQDTLTARVAGRREEAAGIVSFDLVDPDGGDLPEFSAGSHIDVHVAPGLVRQYSLLNHPAERHRYRIAVLREDAGRGGSAAMHDRVQVGQSLAISAPRNAFALDGSAPFSLLLAGGIGITPLLAMAEHLSSTRRPFAFHYCCRTRTRAAFLDRLSANDLAERTRLHFDDGDASQRLDLARVLDACPEGAHLYVCGPNGFMDFVLDAASARLPAAAIHREYFAAPAQPLHDGGESAFQIRLARSGRLFDVPADQTIAAVLQANGVDVPLSCEQGICGTCLVKVVGGIPDHRDTYMTAAERDRNDAVTLCCSRSHSDLLEIDL